MRRTKCGTRFGEFVTTWMRPATVADHVTRVDLYRPRCCRQAGTSFYSIRDDVEAAGQNGRMRSFVWMATDHVSTRPTYRHSAQAVIAP